MKRNLFLACAIIVSLNMWAWDSQSGHTFYFDNSVCQWSNVYLRIETEDAVSIYPFTNIPGNDWWKCATPEESGYTKYTITDNNSTVAGSYPEGANRLYEYGANIDGDRWITVSKRNESDSHYFWDNTFHGDYSSFMISSEAGHQIWFDNSNSQWSNVYLRIGRSEVTGYGNYASTWPMTNVEGTNFWYVNTETWEHAEAWTITDTNDNNGDDHSCYDLPSGANRLYFYKFNLNAYVMYIADGESAQGAADNGNYWANHNSSAAPSVSGCSNCFFYVH